ncbi:HU family DNA-binding protein [Lactobacillus taiwanensis]|jgi:DNA-binding protein HU-beta|uniref:HU family DNA-binding protein n=1 Tax=Lactobacillus taiwanensis TaxID=508451 RepID=UPI001AEC1E5F|nr:HU family DNA-binding protein [Lactobacillus taiwanensis]MCR1904026.1 HU family DNA-binding protein [Lactobacillus taiwanensis]QTQ40897.1 HU family DNA-binding protein [Lactobacillus taiwanensis]
METIGKKELVKLVSTEMNTTKLETDKFIDTFIEVIENQVAEGNKVRLIGFGSFFSRHRGSRKGCDINTGKSFTIPETTVPSFTSGAKFRKKVKDLAK